MQLNNPIFDSIVIGAGHAGIEAAAALSRLGKSVLFITGDKSQIATLPCNPSIGGPAKGVLVREIDALGGLMAKVADSATIQMRRLNSSKGPGVWALRAQIDKEIYPKNMFKELKKLKNIVFLHEYATELLIENQTVIGAVTESNTKYFAKTVVLTTGTYLASRILIGSETYQTGPDGKRTTFGISESLRKAGFEIVRLKTGTPPRIDSNSIDFTELAKQDENNPELRFSYYSKTKHKANLNLHTLHTTMNTKETILANLKYSPLYSGVIEGRGPRYCPSIEDKIVRFKEKDIHQVFVEPESIKNNLTYLQGLSTSLPRFVQRKLVLSLPGFEAGKIIRYGYAIEYDAINPFQLYLSLETKMLKNLFTAGQINGTSGYEEAACQGLIAGTNAAAKIDNIEPLILKRNEAYTGVLIDDIVTKGADEPYRMLTSRAEYRLLLRDDNADFRLSEIAYNRGLIDTETYQKYLLKKGLVKRLTDILTNTKITPTKTVLSHLSKYNVSLYESISLANLLKRPEVNLKVLNHYIKEKFPEDVTLAAEIQIKYEGYILKEIKTAEKFKFLENFKIPADIDYHQVANLAFECREKLEKVRPKTLGQASRILGVNPSDIQILSIYIQKSKVKR